MAAGAMEFWTFWAAMLGVFGFVRNLLPKEYSGIIDAWVRRGLHYLTPYVVLDVPEFYGAGGNEIYDHVQAYLSSSTALAAHHVNLCRPKNATQNTFSLAHNETLEDTFMGAKVWWSHDVSTRQQPGVINWGDTPNDEKRKYTLKIRKADKNRVLEPYVQHVMDVAKSLKDRSRDRLLYTNIKNGPGYKKRAWESVPFKHPSTFDTLAMDMELKEEIKEDLLDFTMGEEFYQKAGKAWKRGYLLYGPPGTGKSSMIAAIANFLQYDVYDVELTEVSSNSELRKLLIQTTNRSVIVIEDIDCSVELAERAKGHRRHTEEKPEKGGGRPGGEDEGSRVTLSGLLNFTDGLWSCCGSERIIIFTTNYIEKLDKALLRAGRMDKHIHMSWCGMDAFRTLAKNNLGLESHALFPEIKKAIADKAVAPADVSEFMLKKKRDPTGALEGLLDMLTRAPLISEKPIVKVNLDEDETTEFLDDTPLADESSTVHLKAKFRRTKGEQLVEIGSAPTDDFSPANATANGQVSESTVL